MLMTVAWHGMALNMIRQELRPSHVEDLQGWDPDTYMERQPRSERRLPAITPTNSAEVNECLSALIDASNFSRNEQLTGSIRRS